MSIDNVVVIFRGGRVVECVRDGDIVTAVLNTAMAWSVADDRIVTVKPV